jgi:CubicO group peptidase (beta-lactamase class C family)
MNPKSKHSNLALFFVVVLLFAATIPAKADATDEYARAQMRERHVPGAAIAVIKDGKIVKAEGYGLANVELNVPATKETVFEIGSVSKQITAAAIMLLVEEGKVNLDEKISKYLSAAPETWKNVTVRNLLTHTSGIKSYTGLSGFELTKRLKRDEFVRSIGTHPLEFEPGERYIYSNSGYNLLGFIIESVSGESYWEFLQKRIFKPLGMNKTANRDPQFIVPNRADGYEWENGRLVGRDYDLTDVFSAGAIVSTVTDLAKWDAALRGETFLKKDSKEKIWTPVRFNNGKSYPYGLGWNVTEFRRHKLFSHGGQTAGFAANISRYADDNLTVIVLTNLGDQGLGSAIARGIAKIYLPDISLRAMKEQKNANANITKQMQNALRSYLEEKLDAAAFTDRTRAFLTTERAKLNSKRIASYGAIKNFVLVGSETADKNKIYRYKAETDSRIFLWRFELDESGKISAMSLEEEE